MSAARSRAFSSRSSRVRASSALTPARATPSASMVLMRSGKVAQTEGGAEVLRGRAHVADGRVLGLVVPLADRDARQLGQQLLAVDLAEVLLGVDVGERRPRAAAWRRARRRSTGRPWCRGRSRRRNGPRTRWERSTGTAPTSIRSANMNEPEAAAVVRGVGAEDDAAVAPRRHPQAESHRLGAVGLRLRTSGQAVDTRGDGAVAESHRAFAGGCRGLAQRHALGADCRGGAAERSAGGTAGVRRRAEGETGGAARGRARAERGAGVAAGERVAARTRCCKGRWPWSPSRQRGCACRRRRCRHRTRCCIARWPACRTPKAVL